jgi:hypothetical protein
MWRASAVFAGSEVESLISDDRIEGDRRVLSGMLCVARSVSVGR